MNPNSQEKFDLDRFYSTESVEAWKQIIGEDLHYHFGYFRGSEDLENDGAGLLCDRDNL